MAKRSQYHTQGQEGRGGFCTRTWKGRAKGCLSYKQLESALESSPDSILVYNKDEKIIRINAKALRLFEVTSADSWEGKSFQQFLQDYQASDLRQRPTSAESWFMNLVRDKEARCDSPEQTFKLHMPSGRRVYVDHWRVPLFDERQHTLGSISVLHNITHRYQKALHLQRVYEAILVLTETVAHLPEHIDLTTSQDMPLLSTPIIFVAQSLVNVIRQVLECRRVSLMAFAFGSSGHAYLVAGNGLTREQEQYWQERQGHVPIKNFVEETVLAHLSTHQEVILQGDGTHRPLPFRPTDGTENLLLIPLFLKQQWIGVLSIVNVDAANSYTSEEVELVKAVAAQTELIIQCLVHLNQEVEGQTRAVVQYEIHRLSNDFLTLASHELLTPLTAIFGNIQLAQRRLEALKRHAVDQHESIEQVQRPLVCASESASLQKRMINDLIDDAQIQTNRLTLHMDHHDLLTLLKEAVSRQRQSVPESTIVLKILPTEQSVPIFADAERITRVLNTYLVNALTHSPSDAPVTVELVVSDAQALVLVHDEGPGITQDEQERLWERFYRAKGSAVQHELDLSLGLGFYLCRALIEFHHGRVGVQSDLGRGETFWLTLPVVAFPEE